MIEINKASDISLKVLGSQGYKNEVKYRKIKYMLSAEAEGGRIWYNTLTSQIYYLTDEEISSLDAPSDNGVFAELVKAWFYVPEDYDEYILYNLLYTFTKQSTKKDKITHYTILPTTDCNARCFYCFEHGMKRYSMTEKTAEDVAEFILKKSPQKGVSIEWFGGEPLYNKKAIEIICSRLKKENIEFTSTMISNGYLFDDQIIAEAKSDWNLSRVQITLDGTEEIYNKYKAYIHKEDKSPFKRVIANVKKLLENGIKVFLRVNVGNHNIDDIYALVDYIDKEIGPSLYLHLYAWPLYENRGAKKEFLADAERLMLHNEINRLERYINEKSLKTLGRFDSTIQTNSCMADDDGAMVILPDGRLGKCDHSLEDRLVGNIYSDTLDAEAVKAWKQYKNSPSACGACPLAPICRKNKNCPEEPRDCDSIERDFRINKLSLKLLRAYKNIDKE